MPGAGRGLVITVKVMRGAIIRRALPGLVRRRLPGPVGACCSAAFFALSAPAILPVLITIRTFACVAMCAPRLHHSLRRGRHGPGGMHGLGYVHMLMFLVMVCPRQIHKTRISILVHR